MMSVAPLSVWAAVSFALLAMISVGSIRGEKSPLRKISACAALLLAYLVGVGGADWLRHAVSLPPSTLIEDYVDPLVWLLHRSFFLLGAAPLALVYLLQRPSGVEHPVIRFGSWSEPHGDGSPVGRWRRWPSLLALWVVILILPATLFFHAQSGFALFTSGRLFVFFVPIVGMAVFNAYAEEVVFRGLLLPAMGDQIGSNRANWAQALLFGMLHFGSSPAPLGAAAVLAVATMIGVLFGKSVVETRGIGWAVIAHAFADFSFFSVQFIA